MTNKNFAAKPTVRELAQAQIDAEKAAAAQRKMTDLLRKRDAAALVVANIDREIEDLELAIEQGSA